MQWNVSGGRFLSELHGLLCREVMVRRLKVCGRCMMAEVGAETR